MDGYSALERWREQVVPNSPVKLVCKEEVERVLRGDGAEVKVWLAICSPGDLTQVWAELRSIVETQTDDDVLRVVVERIIKHAHAYALDSLKQANISSGLSSIPNGADPLAVVGFTAIEYGEHLRRALRWRPGGRPDVNVAPLLELIQSGTAATVAQVNCALALVSPLSPGQLAEPAGLTETEAAISRTTRHLALLIAVREFIAGVAADAVCWLSDVPPLAEAPAAAEQTPSSAAPPSNAQHTNDTMADIEVVPERRDAESRDELAAATPLNVGLEQRYAELCEQYRLLSEERIKQIGVLKSVRIGCDKRLFKAKSEETARAARAFAEGSALARQAISAQTNQREALQKQLDNLQKQLDKATQQLLASRDQVAQLNSQARGSAAVAQAHQVASAAQMVAADAKLRQLRIPASSTPQAPAQTATAAQLEAVRQTLTEQLDAAQKTTEALRAELIASAASAKESAQKLREAEGELQKLARQGEASELPTDQPRTPARTTRARADDVRSAAPTASRSGIDSLAEHPRGQTQPTGLASPADATAAPSRELYGYGDIRAPIVPAATLPDTLHRLKAAIEQASPFCLAVPLTMMRLTCLEVGPAAAAPCADVADVTPVVTAYYSYWLRGGTGMMGSWMMHNARGDSHQPVGSALDSVLASCSINGLWPRFARYTPI